MIFGFGSTERETAKRILGEIAAALLDGGGAEGVRAVQEEYERAADRNKELPASEAPERYSQFWSMFYEDIPGHAVVTVRFLHYNRRHPFSPDGWAAMNSDWLLLQDWEGFWAYERVDRVADLAPTEENPADDFEEPIESRIDGGPA